MNGSPSNLSLDNESNNEHTTSPNNLNMIASLSGDFNLYQLDGNSGNTIDENSELLISSTHSSSHQLNSASKSLHSFTSLQQAVNEVDETLAESSTPATASATSGTQQMSTKFIRQHADNISERVVCEANPKMVSMGCQTFSTGDITVSNVFIE